jgi:hypothetical protein
MAGLATPRMAALRPGQSPPLVRMPMQRARLVEGKSNLRKDYSIPPNTEIPRTKFQEPRTQIPFFGIWFLEFVYLPSGIKRNPINNVKASMG